MSLHPAVAFATVIAGAALFGAVGALLALPAAAVIQALGSTYIARHEVIETDMTAQPSPRKPWFSWRRDAPPDEGQPTGEAPAAATDSQTNV
jgi:hypothetical protein